MQLANAPSKIVLAFAADGNKNAIPVPSQISVTPGAASWTDGFPPVTMLDPTEGGVGPSGLDFNGVINEISAVALWLNTGAGFAYDAAFSTAIGGYPIGSRVLRSDNSGYWLCIADNNTNDPNAGGAGWIPQGSSAASSVYASAQQTLGAGNSKILFDTVEFDDGIWDAANKRFLAHFPGRYRISGAVMLSAPGGQLLATQIWKNGALAKQCFQAPQVSDGNLSLPFDAMLNLAVGDYLEAYLLVTQTAVLAGVVGSNQPYVFAQLEYLGT